MISVVISINGNPILARSTKRIDGETKEVCSYQVDDGSIIKHKPNEGAVILAKKMLDTIDLDFEIEKRKEELIQKILSE